jgi:hypothetical protein
MTTLGPYICNIFKQAEPERSKNLRVLLDKASLNESAILAILQYVSIYCVGDAKGDTSLGDLVLNTLDKTVYKPFDGTVTLTFGDVAESHVGMQQIGTMADRGFSLLDLQRSQIYFERLGVTTKIIHLNKFLPKDESIDDPFEKKFLKIAREDPASQAYLLVVRNGIELLTKSPKGKNLLIEMLIYKWDSKLWNARKKVVQNKLARHNLNFSDTRQEPDFSKGKGTTVAWGDVPILNSLRAKLIDAFGSSAKYLKCEGNLYYSRGKTGIGYHGDTERRKVIGVRLGHRMNIHYMWYYNDRPRGLNMSIMLEEGDIYCMSEKAVGTDWRPNKKAGFKKKSYVLRHAAGASKPYTRENSKMHLYNTHKYADDPEISVSNIEHRKKNKDWMKMPN